MTGKSQPELASRKCLHSQVAGKWMDELGKNMFGPTLVSGKKKTRYFGRSEVPRTLKKWLLKERTHISPKILVPVPRKLLFV